MHAPPHAPPPAAPPFQQQHQLYQQYQQHHEHQQQPFLAYGAPGEWAGGGGSIMGATQPQHQQQQQQQRLDPFALDEDADRLRAVRELPAAFQPLFNFRYFNLIQSEVFDMACGSDAPLVVAAPTGSGKTGILELALLRLWGKRLDATGQRLDDAQRGRGKAVYLAPIRALVQERQADWASRFAPLGLSVVELSGDADAEVRALEGADLICTTPEKFDHVSRRANEAGAAGFLGDVALVLIDEVHLLHEPGRGASLEAGVVSRIKMLARLPEMAGAPVTAVRFLAVSATVPNLSDIGDWLGAAAPGGVRAYGDELRPVKLTTVVKGYPPSKNDFLFERRLNDHVYGVVADHGRGRPALVFCSSRKSAADTADAIAKGAAAAAAARGAGGGGGPFVRGAAHAQRLQQAAAATKNKALAALLPAGVGFHNAAIEAEDRALVEGLFRDGALPVLCTTSTLAMGVNLPAHLVVVKGTRRYVGNNADAGAGGAGGAGAGYAEYSRGEVLQMVGRAGRPQFDTEGVAVVMTLASSAARYAELAAGAEAVESTLHETAAEHLNAEVVLGTVRDVSRAVEWLRTTFLYTRARANPRRYGVALPPGAPPARVDAALRDALVLRGVGELVKHGLMATDEEGFELRATEAGRLMARHAVRLPTMAAFVALPRGAVSMAALIAALARAAEFSNITLRRSEKKALNAANQRPYAEGGARFPVMEAPALPPPAAATDGAAAAAAKRPAAGGAPKVKARIQTAAEKIQVLINEALSNSSGGSGGGGNGSTAAAGQQQPPQQPGEAFDFALRQEQEQLLRVGQRLVRCAAKYYAADRRLAAAGNAALLARALRTRVWEDAAEDQARQLPSVGPLLGARLKGAGFGALRALLAADPRRIELAVQRGYPFGATLQASARALMPPPVTLSLRQLAALPGGGADCEVTLTRSDGAGAAAAAAAAGGGGSSSSTAVDAPATLLVGCPLTDDLLHQRFIQLSTFASPLTLRVRVPPQQSGAANGRRPVLLAALLPEKVSGADMSAHLVLQAAGGGGGGGSASISTAPPSAVEAADGLQQRRAAPEGCEPAAAPATAVDDDAPAERLPPPPPAKRRRVQPRQTRAAQPVIDEPALEALPAAAAPPPSFAAGAAAATPPEPALSFPRPSTLAASGYARFLQQQQQQQPQQQQPEKQQQQQPPPADTPHPHASTATGLAAVAAGCGQSPAAAGAAVQVTPEAARDGLLFSALDPVLSDLPASVAPAYDAQLLPSKPSSFNISGGGGDGTAMAPLLPRAADLLRSSAMAAAARAPGAQSLLLGAPLLALGAAAPPAAGRARAASAAAEPLLAAPAAPIAQRPSFAAPRMDGRAAMSMLQDAMGLKGAAPMPPRGAAGEPAGGAAAMMPPRRSGLLANLLPPPPWASGSSSSSGNLPRIAATPPLPLGASARAAAAAAPPPDAADWRRFAFGTTPPPSASGTPSTRVVPWTSELRALGGDGGGGGGGRTSSSSSLPRLSNARAPRPAAVDWGGFLGGGDDDRAAAAAATTARAAPRPQLPATAAAPSAVRVASIMPPLLLQAAPQEQAVVADPLPPPPAPAAASAAATAPGGGGGAGAGGEEDWSFDNVFSFMM